MCACVRACVRACVCVCVDWMLPMVAGDAKEEPKAGASAADAEDDEECEF